MRIFISSDFKVAVLFISRSTGALMVHSKLVLLKPHIMLHHHAVGKSVAHILCNWFCTFVLFLQFNSKITGAKIYILASSISNFRSI